MRRCLGIRSILLQSVSSLPACSGEDTWRATAIEIVAGKPSECLLAHDRHELD
jgi:hypothetical protein